MSYWWAAITIGLIGSAHCAGMCGPILLAVNHSNNSRNAFLHHSGRLFTYAVFGAVAGAVGKSFNMLGVQQQFSLVIGAIMVLSVTLIPLTKRLHKAEGVISKISLRFNSWIHQQNFPKNGVRFLGGIGNGLLPCGLVYLGVAGAANTFTPWDGALFMTLFGLGTLPTLLVLNAVGGKLSIKARNKIRKLIPITVFVMGCLFIVRGANLGIPYLSPAQSQESGQVVECR